MARPLSDEKRNALIRAATRVIAVSYTHLDVYKRQDYEWSVAKLRELALDSRCSVLFSPSHEELPARELADWVLQDRLPVRFQIQLHKYLWGNARGK